MHSENVSGVFFFFFALNRLILLSKQKGIIKLLFKHMESVSDLSFKLFII